MKKGCLLLLFVWVAVAAGYYYLFQGTEYAHAWWGPVLFGLGAAMIVGNIHGIILALQQKSAANRPITQWKDGQFVVISGRIAPTRTPINAPFSGIPSCIVEYTLKYGDNPGGDYMGFLMTPSTITSTQGAVKIVGFPMLAEISSSTYIDDTACKRAGEYFAQCTFKEKSSNPITLISQLNEVLSDDDGIVKVDFADKKASIHIDPMEDGSTAAEGIANRLMDSGYSLEETIIEVGAEVTACGTYRQSKQAVDIGSGLKNISHSLKIGSAAQTTGGLLKQSVITLIIISAIFVGANWLVLPQIGIDPNTFVQKIVG